MDGSGLMVPSVPIQSPENEEMAGRIQKASS